MKGLFRLILSFYVFVDRHAPITQNNKFAISLQYLKKKVSNEVKNFLKIDTMIFDGDNQPFTKFPKQQLCHVFTISQKGS